MSVTCSECVSVVLGIRHAVHCIILPSVSYLPQKCFSTLSHKWHDFQKTFLNIKCVCWFSLLLLSAIFLIRRRNERNMIKKICVCLQ